MPLQRIDRRDVFPVARFQFEQTRACSAVCDTAKRAVFALCRCIVGGTVDGLVYRSNRKGKTRDLGRAGYRAYFRTLAEKLPSVQKRTYRPLPRCHGRVTVPGEVFWRWLHDGSWEEARAFLTATIATTSGCDLMRMVQDTSQGIQETNKQLREAKAV